jgi:hypothetical protein
VAPVVRQEEGTQRIRYLTPEEIAETAKLIQEVTGSNKQPYLLRLFDPGTASDQRMKSVEKMPPNALFPYRSAARRHQVLTEIEKILTKLRVEKKLLTRFMDPSLDCVILDTQRLIPYSPSPKMNGEWNHETRN